MEQIIEFSSRHALLVGGFVAVLLLLVWSEFTRRFSGVREVTAAQAVPLINRDDTVVVDLSASADFAKGHIVGARNIAPSRLAKVDEEVKKLEGKSVLLVCKNGQASPKAATQLKRLGAAEVAVLKGGMTGWLSEQYPVTAK